MLLTEFGRAERWEATSKKRSIDSGRGERGTPVFQAMLRFAQQCFYGVKGRGGRKMSGKNFKPYAPTFIPTMHRKPITNRLIVKSKQGGEMWIV